MISTLVEHWKLVTAVFTVGICVGVVLGFLLFFALYVVWKIFPYFDAWVSMIQAYCKFKREDKKERKK